MKEECRDVLDHVWSFLDGEASPGEAEAVRNHLEGCEPCLSEFEFQEALKSLVRRSCRESAPAALRARIVTDITHARMGGLDVTTRYTEVRLTTER